MDCGYRTSSEIVDWIRHHTCYPVVVKPTRGAGVSGVKICSNESQVAEASSAILNDLSYYGESQEHILVQSYSDGQEYIVDAVSFDGHHRLVSVWEVERVREHAPRLEKMVVVDHQQERYSELIRYAWEVLDAVGLRYGPSHMEVMVTQDGPTIIELNSRLHGSLDPRLTTAVNGQNHVSATVDAFIDPPWFIKNVGRPIEFRGFCGHLLLTSPKNGTLMTNFAWSALERVPSFVSVKKWVHAGDRVVVTSGLQTAVGMVGLFHKDFEQLLRDCLLIREIERTFFADPASVAA